MDALLSTNVATASITKPDMGIFSDFLKSLGGRMATTIGDDIKKEDFLPIFTRKYDFKSYGYADLIPFQKDWAAYNLLRKSAFLDLGFDKEKAAYDSFYESEVSCKSINDREYLHGKRLEKSSIPETLEVAKKLISDALGEFSFDEWAQDCAHGSGASFESARYHGHPVFKRQGELECTVAAAPILSLFSSSDLVDRELRRLMGNDFSLKIVQGSRSSTVSKETTKDRTVAFEPAGNMFLQKGLGKKLRRVLKKLGVDLNDQSLNQLLAYWASLTGSLATVDLKQASDSIACLLVKFLFPTVWYDAFMASRSPYTLIEGEWLELEKISSMGNGFTFELESLIFWALTKACATVNLVRDPKLPDCIPYVADHRVSVYGDDIICSQELECFIKPLFSYVGFTINEDKSFFKGPFRESCGGHYFLGSDVTPIYVKDEELSFHTNIFLVNSLRLKPLWFFMRDMSFYKRHVDKLLKSDIPRVPLQLGLTSGIISNWDEAMFDIPICRTTYLKQRLTSKIWSEGRVANAIETFFGHPKYNRGARWSKKRSSYTVSYYSVVEDNRKQGQRFVSPSFRPWCHNAYLERLAYNTQFGLEEPSRYAKKIVDDGNRISANLSLSTSWKRKITRVREWPVVPSMV